MLLFEITDGATAYQYKCPETAKDFTCSDILKYQEEVEPLKPQSLKDLEEIEEQEERERYIIEMPEDTMETLWIEFYMREICHFCKIEPDHAALLPLSEVLYLRNLIFKALAAIKGILIPSFKLGEYRYFLPDAPVNMFNPERRDYMSGCTLGEFATAHQLHKAFSATEGGEMRGLLHIMAVLCRRKGESFPAFPKEQDDLIQERIKLFSLLDYQTAYNVGFFLLARRMKLNNASPSSEQAMARLPRLVKNTVTTQ